MDHPRSILLILPGALGDVVNTIPALKALRAHFPGSRLEAAGTRERMELLLAGRIVDAIYEFDLHGFQALFAEKISEENRIKKFLEKFDLIISWIQDRHGFLEQNLEKTGKPSIFFREKLPLAKGSGPASETLSQPVRELGIKEFPAWPGLELPSKHLHRATEILGEDCSACLVVHPGSGSKSKCWPPERFAQAADVLAREFSLQVLALEGPADELASARMCGNLGSNPRLIRNRSVLDVACVLSRARIYLGNDSGISHLAAALGVPSVVIFGPTDPAVWGPREPWARIIAPAVACAPCSEEVRRTCPERKCLDELQVREVIIRARELLRESGR
jgi:ADP-heptose:LPS heptosyltransferase